MKLAIVIPSRGLIHSRTIDAVIHEARTAGYDWTLHIAHSRPIPHCFNEPIREALTTGPTHVWVVEEDTRLPAGVLADLIAARKPFAACDYPLQNGQRSVQRDRTGRVLWTGTGCLLATAEALATVLPFRADISYIARGNDQWEPVTVDDPTRYGGHDVHLGLTLHAAGTPIHVIDIVCGQWRVIRPARPDVNALGWHDIAEL